MIWVSTLVLVAALGGQQPTARPAEGRPDSSGITVYLLTFDPGDALWERFGHNALWIRDSVTGTDWAYDYGRFSFGRTLGQRLGFFARFAHGEPLYSMGDGDVRAYLAAYQEAGRSIWSQELDLPPVARRELKDFLLWNIQEQNKYYPYNYYLDNCSTRLRDAIDRAVGGQLKTWAQNVETTWTYRDHTRRTTENDALSRTALMLGLGRPVDRPLTAWQEMFLPISLRPYLNRLQVRDPDGRVHPLVKAERHLVESSRFSVAAVPSNWVPGYLGVGLIAGLAVFGLGVLARSGGAWRRVFVAVVVFWSLVAGLAGAVLLGLWAFTTHRVSYWNENLLQLNVLSLALAVVAARIHRSGRAGLERAWRMAAAVGVIGLVGLGGKLWPGSQANLDMIVLLLPVHLAVAAGLGRLRSPATLVPPA